MTSASTFSEAQSPEEKGDGTAVTLQPPEAVHLPPRPTPAETEKFFLHGAEPRRGQVTALHTAASIQQIIDHAASNLRAEVGGVLLGKAYQENEHLVVEVQAALPARNDDHGPVHFTFTADAWSQIHHERQAEYAGLDIVGWFHTHPGLGVFYSSDDVVVHSAAFTMPWHVGLVVDPLRSEAAYFGWVDGELTPLDGFYEIQRTPNAKKVAPWRVVRTAVWHERQTEAFYASYEQDHDGLEPANRPQMLEEKLDATQMAVWAGAGALVMGFFLLLLAVLPLRRQVSDLQTAVFAQSADPAVFNGALCENENLRLYTPLAESALTIGARTPIIGTADWDTAARYRLETRPAEGGEWVLISVVRRPLILRRLAVWDTTEMTPGAYELRLTAVDRNNIRLSETPDCIIPLTLIP